MTIGCTGHHCDPDDDDHGSRMTSSAKDTTNNSQLIDRQKVCPFLLRLFLCEGRHHPMSEYTNKRTPLPKTELQIYTWLDATLSELMGLIRELPPYRNRGTQFSFSVVFPEPSSPTFRMRHIGVTIGGKRGPNDDLTLAQSRLQIGDFIDVAIVPMGGDMTRLNNNQSSHNKNRNRGRGRGGGGGGGGGGAPPGRFHR